MALTDAQLAGLADEVDNYISNLQQVGQSGITYVNFDPYGQIGEAAAQLADDGDDFYQNLYNQAEAAVEVNNEVNGQGDGYGDFGNVEGAISAAAEDLQAVEDFAKSSTDAEDTADNAANSIPSTVATTIAPALAADLSTDATTIGNAFEHYINSLPVSQQQQALATTFQQFIAMAPKTGTEGDVQSLWDSLTGDLGAFFGDTQQGAATIINAIPTGTGTVSAYLGNWLTTVSAWFLNAWNNTITPFISQYTSAFWNAWFGAGPSNASNTVVSGFLTTPLPSTQQTALNYINEINQIAAAPRNVAELFGAIFLRISTAFTAIAASIEPFIVEVNQEAAAQTPTTLIPVDTLIRGVQQGVVTPAAAQQEALYAGVSVADYETLTVISVTPVSPSTALQATVRTINASSAILASAFNVPVPANVTPFYTIAGVNAEQAQIDWDNHWVLPDTGSATVALFRGLITQADFNSIAAAGGTPPAWAELIPALSKPTIPTRTVLTLLANNLISQQQATQYFAAEGYNSNDQATLLAYATTIRPRRVPAAAQDLSKLAITDAVALYNEGTINEAELLTIYEAHGYTPDAAQLAVEYVQLKEATVKRKAAAMEIVDEVDVGQISIAQGVSSLYAAGFTTPEVLQYQKIMKKSAQGKVVLPSVSEVTDLLKAGAMSLPDAELFLQRAGYTDPFYSNFVVYFAGLIPAAATQTAVVTPALPPSVTIPPQGSDGTIGEAG